MVQEEPKAISQLENVHGRDLIVDALYALPRDAEEHRRLNAQHEIQRRIFGGLIPVPELILPVLTQTEGHVTRILDIGTGSGAWSIDMAREFPHCEVFGLDLVPPASNSAHPANVQFVAHDVNFPLPMETGSVDLVHARFVDAGIRCYPAWLSEVARVLRSGGAYAVIAGDDPLVQEDGTELPHAPIGEPGYSGLENSYAVWVERTKAVSGGFIPSQHWVKLLNDNKNFNRVGRNEEKLVPIGPWPKDMDDNTRIAAEIMRQNVLSVLHAHKPWMLREGHDATKLDRWTEDAISELSELRIRVSVSFTSAWAIRSDELWKPYEATEATGAWAAALDREAPERYIA